MLSLADAILEENMQNVMACLHQGINLNELDEYGFTPLIEAAIADNIEITKALIDFGANVNFQDSVGSTALHWAAENNNLELCKLLLLNGANPNAYTLAGQPVLVMPLLRQHQNLKRLLIDAGANLDFAQDYINTKFIGHLFELVGTADIVDPANQFIEVDFEGFFLEVTLSMIAESIAQFKMHFAGREIRRYSDLTEVIIQVMSRAARLIKYQQYRVDRKKHASTINALIQQEPLIIPIAYDGHAITFVKLGDILVKCDRREDSRLYDNIVFYRMNRPDAMTADFIKKLIFEKQPGEIFNEILPHILDLVPLTELKVTAQISGNCSWANVEACIPVLYFLLFSNANDFEANISRYKKVSLDFFHQWREWNKDRSLGFLIQSFKHSDVIRKACKAEILAAVLFQSCDDDSPRSKERAEDILAVLANPHYGYVLENYVKSYCYESTSDKGKRFLRMLQDYGFMDL